MIGVSAACRTRNRRFRFAESPNSPAPILEVLQSDIRNGETTSHRCPGCVGTGLAGALVRRIVVGTSTHLLHIVGGIRILCPDREERLQTGPLVRLRLGAGVVAFPLVICPAGADARPDLRLYYNFHTHPVVPADLHATDGGRERGASAGQQALSQLGAHRGRRKLSRPDDGTSSRPASPPQRSLLDAARTRHHNGQRQRRLLCWRHVGPQPNSARAQPQEELGGHRRRLDSGDTGPGPRWRCGRRWEWRSGLVR